jgi:hypothetical protein
MHARTIMGALLAAALIAGCRADREAAEGVRFDASEELRQAPGYPIEPRGVPVPGTPEAAEQARRDTRPDQPLDPDTVPQFDPPAED